MSTVSFYTLGCRLNQSETASLQKTFEIDGYQIVDIKKSADIVVINTCTVTQNGDADARRLVNRVSRLNPQTKIALIGCQAQVQKEKLTAWPNVRWVIGNAQKMNTAALIRSLKDDEPAQVITPTIPRDDFTIPMASVDERHTRANIKIQDGCDFFCSFCEIPYARGRARSRVFEDILSEADTLVKARHKELVLTGINIGTYKQNNHTIVDVIDALEQINGLARIRISSIEPTTIPKILLNKMARRSKLCRYLHIPLQSGDDSVLREMKRKYTVAAFNDFIQQAYDLIPDVCIGTDVIVGFPGESEPQFQNTVDFLRENVIHYFHVFSYSHRNMAHSRQYADPVPVEMIQKRSKALRDLSARKRHMFYESLIGQTQNVLFEQKKDGFWNGLTDHYVRVKTQSDKDLTNQLLPIRLLKVDSKGFVNGKESTC